MSKYCLLLLLYTTLITAFNINHMITRRSLLMTSMTSICFTRPPANAHQTDDNPPLTPAEMQEYKRLLKEAERIQNIIDINMKAANRTLEDDLFKMKNN